LWINDGGEDSDMMNGTGPQTAGEIELKFSLKIVTFWKMPSHNAHFKTLRLLGKVIGCSSTIYSLAVLLAHFLSVVLVAVDIWSRPGLASTRLVKTADYFIKVSITTTAILTHILKKRNIDKLLASLDQIESLLPPRRHTWRFPNHCDVIFIFVFTGTRLAFHQASTPTLYHALSDLEEFQVWVFVVTSVKFLTLLERFFSRTNDHLELLLQDDPRSIDHLYEKLYRVLELWNDLYGVQLLQLFLHIFVVLVDNIINVVLELHQTGPVSWTVAFMSTVILTYLVRRCSNFLHLLQLFCRF
jgi:hypothetical protein